MPDDRERMLDVTKNIVLGVLRQHLEEEEYLEGDGLEPIDTEFEERLLKHLPKNDQSLERMLAVLEQSQEQLLTTGGTTTKREIYYSDVQLFGKKQDSANRSAACPCLLRFDSLQQLTQRFFHTIQGD
jgi:DNA topoisomerase VI subunit A